MTSKSDLASILSASALHSTDQKPQAEKPAHIFCCSKARPLIINEALGKHRVFPRLISFFCRLFYSLECEEVRVV